MVGDFESDFLEEESHTVFGWLVEQGSTWCVILLSPVVVSSIVICAGGLHSSTHWHTCILQQHALCGGVYIHISTYIYHHCRLPPHSASCSSGSARFICIYLHLHMQLCTTTTDHHHTVQVARVQVQYLRQWLDEKAPPAQVAEGDTTTCASGLSALVAE